MTKKESIGLILAGIGFVIPLLVTFSGLTVAGHLALSIFLAAAALWLFESIPIYATSIGVIFLEALLLSSQSPLMQNASPLNYLPVTETSADLPDDAIRGGYIWYESANGEVASIKAANFSSDKLEGSRIIANPGSALTAYTAPSYSVFFSNLAGPIIILFLGGFVLAAIAVKYKMDQALTSVLLKPFGTKPIMILLGLMMVTAILSAFMSNTATTAMMITVVVPIIAGMKQDDPFRIALVLGIPVAANIGGMATPIGTPPNAVVIGALSKSGISIEFGQWMSIAGPVVIIMLFVALMTLYLFFKPQTQEIKLQISGGFSKDARSLTVYAILALTVILWITESVHGLKSALVAMIPIVGFSSMGVLGKKEIRSLPWEVLWLVGGGIALGTALSVTGLANWLVNQVDWTSLSSFTLLVVFVLLAVGVSNFLSNTVTATLLMPLAISLGAVSPAIAGYDMFTVSVLIGLGASLAMVLPISTPPNAIAMSTGLVETKHMIRVGLVIGIIGAIFTLIFAIFVWPLIVG